MIGTVHNRNILHRMGDAWQAFKAAPSPAQLYAPGMSVSTGFLSFPGYDALESRGPSNTADEKNARAATASPFVYRNITAIAKEISVANLDVKQRAGEDGDTDITNHPLEKLWENPNEFMGRSWLMQFWTWQLLLFGEAYLYYIPSHVVGKEELWPIPTLFMTPVPDTKRFVSGFLFKRNSADEGIPIDTRPIIYSRLPNPFDIRRGLSPLAALMIEVLGDQSMARWNANFFSKENAAPTGVISVPKDTLDTDLARIRQEIREFFGGSSTQRVAVARAGDLSWEAFDRSQKDMEFLAGRTFNSKLIDTVFGIPEGFWAKDATRANSEGAKATMIENAVWPHLVMLQEDLNAQLIPQWYGDDLRAEFDDIRPRNRALELQELTIYQGFLTIDELRKRIDEDEIGDVRGTMLIAEVTKGTPLPATPTSEETEDYLGEQEEEAGIGSQVSGVGEDGAALVPNTRNPRPDTQEEGVMPTKSEDRERWERKALKNLKRFHVADVRFESDAIPFPEQSRIHAALKAAETAEAIRAAFKAQAKRRTVDDLADDAAIIARARELREGITA